MLLFKRSLLYILLQNSHIKFIYFSIFYKIIVNLKYTFFFFLHQIYIKFLYYRLYLLNVNFFFLFKDYIYFVHYFEHLNKINFTFTILPVKIKTYSVLRSPFVYSKSREHFAVYYYCLFFDLKPWKLSSVYLHLLENSLYNLQLHHSKFWYKRFINL
jgi:hypothetical protein